MIIDGFNKLTLLDYPKHVACIIFTRGCNYKCSYCQNSPLIKIDKDKGLISEEEILKYLEKRKHILEGIVISGGEPTIQKDLKNFIKKVKKLKMKIKLDTNGSNPLILKELIEENLIDYVAMDIKTNLIKYEEITCCKINKENIKKSINILRNSNIDHEFRTTIIKEYHTISDIKEILKLIPNEKFYIQNFLSSENVLNKDIHGFTHEQLKNILEELKKEYPLTEVRGL